MKRNSKQNGPHSISSVVPVRIFMYISRLLSFGYFLAHLFLAVHFVFQGVLLADMEY